MDVLNFVMEHWADILVLILILVMIWSFFRRWLPKFGPMSDAEKIAVTTRLLENVAPAVLSIVIEAERIYGSGTGPLKRSYVIGEIYKLITDEFKKYVRRNGRKYF